MRAVVIVALMLLAACASDKMALVPRPGVDLSGHWKLNEADSDDPLRLVQSQNAANAPSAQGGGGQGGGGQGGGRGGRQGGRGGPGAGLPGGPTGPAMPGMGAMGAGLRWPGKTLEVKQVAGVVTFDSDGKNQVFRPIAGDRKSPPHHGPPGDNDPSHGREMPAHGRGDGPPPRCGWEERTLVVQGDDPDDDQPPFEERYSLSEDGQRLIEVVGFKSGRSAGFTLSRVWDKAGPEGLKP